MPGSAHNTIASRTSVRPKAWKCLGGASGRRKPGKVAPGKTGLQESCMLPKRKRTRMTICTYNTQTLPPDAAIEDLTMKARKFKTSSD
ncbi:hypothetical protein NECAME_13916 [Necator americanus]|uniref:Uncharacterized protein n=1 Tax=Necator americanus TaxID=51031 RepID=W2SS14_NECAM|nr:hypothetical protein NECAME_13916 [Necator americanus]ETN72273.1 hypothetical protein NECAME_13916 [Necator americanus]